MFFEGDWFVNSGERAISKFIDQEKIIFDGIAAGNDNMIAGAINELNRRGIDIQNKIRVIGFDNSIYAESYGFSSVTQPYELMIEKAIEYLLEQLNLKKNLPKRISLDCELVIRKNYGSKMPEKQSSFFRLVENLDSTKWNELIHIKNYFKFSSVKQKILFLNDLKVFCKSLFYVVVDQKKHDDLIHLKNMYLEILQVSLLNKISISYWQNIIFELEQECKK